MLNRSFVSIIVPVYKVESYLHRCIDSVLAQTYSNWELILVDDGSPDSCPQICDDYAAHDLRIKVIHKQNGGQAEARNFGLDISQGEYVMFLDSDDYIHRNMLSKMVSVLEVEKADIVQCGFLRGHLDIFPSINESVTLKYFDNHSIFSSKFNKVVLWAKLYRKDLWKGLCIPTGICYEDDASTWQLYYRSRKTVVLDIPYYYYYANPNSTMAVHQKRLSIDFISIYQKRISYFKERSEHSLQKISQWRFCLPLMMGYMRGNITTEEKAVLLSLFKENVKTAISCSKVPLSHRIILSVFSIWPQGFRMFFELIGKAHTIKE